MKVDSLCPYFESSLIFSSFWKILEVPLRQQNTEMMQQCSRRRRGCRDGVWALRLLWLSAFVASIVNAELVRLYEEQVILDDISDVNDIVVGQVNQRGPNDLVIVGNSSSLSLLQRPNKNWETTPTLIDFLSDSQNHQVALGDLDGDGQTNIVTASTPSQPSMGALRVSLYTEAIVNGETIVSYNMVELLTATSTLVGTTHILTGDSF